MKFDKTVPDWEAQGAEPPSSLKTSGFSAGYKPPAAYFNWFWSKVSACLKELQTKLSNVDNTADVDKSVKYASTSGAAGKTNSSITIRMNGGDTEGTDKFTFDGSVGKSVNITADKIGAAKKDGKSTIIAATSTDGIAYTATLDGITELFDGLKITIIPDRISASRDVSLNLNNLGAKRVRVTLPFNSSNAGTQPSRPTWLGANSPLELTYHSRFNTWKTELQMASGSDLYGKVPIQGGGTYANSETTEADKAKARQDLGIETANGTTVSQNADYAEVGEWADGNPNAESRIGYFVAIDDSSAGETIVVANASQDVRGVTVAAPAFSGNCAAAKFGDDGNLLKQYAYVAVMGLASVIDNGTCTINGRCMPNNSGTAVPSSNNMGYQVIDRIDETHILIAVEPSADMLKRIKDDIANLSSDKYSKPSGGIPKTDLDSSVQGSLGKADTALQHPLILDPANDYGATLPSSPKTNQLFFQTAGLNFVLDNVYPIGAVYISINSTSPSTLFGGTWTKVEGKFLLGASSSYPVGSTGGSKDAVVVAHSHNPANQSGYYGFITSASAAFTIGDMGSQSGSGRYYPYSTVSYDVSRNTQTGSTGVSGTDKNMPPYLVVNIWYRTA